jgi:primosomal protein N' (replication factor Y)
VPLSAGAEQLGRELGRSLSAPVVVLQGYAPAVPDPPAVLVMTRGSVLPSPPGPVGAVVLGDLDRLAGRPRLDAAEDTLRLAMTMAGWARRSGTEGAVLVPALDGQQALVRALVSWDPDLFWQLEIERRAPLRFPPVATVIHVDVPSDAPELPWPTALGEMAARPLGEGRRRHQVRTHDRIGAVRHLVDILAEWSTNGITDTRVDVEPVDLD